MSDTTDEAPLRLGEIIARRRKDIEGRWLDRVVHDPFYAPSSRR